MSGLSCKLRMNWLPALLGALALPTTALAASEEEELAAVFGDRVSISIATGRPQPLRRAPAVATVITAQDIAAMGAIGLDEVLESVPGMHVSRNAQAYNPLYVVRGIFSELNPQTLMLQNGVPMTTLLVGNRGVIWGGMPVENIERIEIIRGPGSALYGADAYAGVINIITRHAGDKPGTELGLRAGSFNTRDGWLQHGGKLGPLELAVYLRVGRTDGARNTIEADAQSGIDALLRPLGVPPVSLAPGPVNRQYESTDASLELGYDKLRLRAGYKRRDDVGAGAGVASALDPVGRAASERSHAELSWDGLLPAPDWRVGLSASYLRYVQRIPRPVRLFPPGAFGNAFPEGMFGAPNTWERQFRLSAVAAYTGFERHNLRIGLGRDDLDLYRTQEFKNFTLYSPPPGSTGGPPAGTPIPTPGAQLLEFPVAESFLSPHRRKIGYAYLQDEWSFAPDWTFTGGIRRDHYSDFGSTTNPRLALVWEVNLALTAKLLYGSAFRAPSFNEQYGVNPVAAGNPAIRPETIKTLEAALQWQAHPDLQLGISTFRYQMRDIIRTVPNAAPAPGATFQNIGAQHGHGLELEWAWQPGRSLRLSGNYAWQRSIDDSTDADAGNSPHHHLYARADWSLAAGWQLSGQLNQVRDRRRAAGDLRPAIPDYTTLDLTLRSDRGSQGWNFTASVLNLFNADVREPTLAPGSIPADLPMPRRSIYLQASYRL